jgi:hypothetical protein
MMASMEPVDESYFDNAPQRFARTWSIARPAAAVWAELVGERPLHWCRGLTIRWTSPQPFGVGTTRQAKTFGGLTRGDEYFFIWEEGRRYAFYFTESNPPLFTSLAEDYTVEPNGPDHCLFSWRVGLTPSALGKPGAPLNKLLFSSFFRDTGRYFNVV